MEKQFFSFVTAIVFLLLSNTNTSASVVTVTKQGTVQMKVLGAKDELALIVPKSESLEVKEISDAQVSGYSTVMIAKDQNKVNLEVSDGVNIKNLDVSDVKSEIIEIEERPQVKKVKIGITDGRFSVSQSEITALTNYPLKVDSKSAEISVVTLSGEKYLSVFPSDAVDTLLKSKLVSKIPGKRIEIVDVEDGLQYQIAGERVFTILDFYEYSIPITSNVSATTGEILYVDAPGWLKVINVLFT